MTNVENKLKKIQKEKTPKILMQVIKIDFQLNEI